MGNYAHTTTKQVLLSVDPSEVPLPFEDWIEPQGLLDLVRAGVPFQPPRSHLNYVDIGGGVFEAQEMTQPEKDAVDLPIFRAQKIAELGTKVLDVVRRRMELGAVEADILAAIIAAATPAAVLAIDVNGVNPQLYGKMVGDSLYLLLTTPGAAMGAAGSWVKAPGTTTVAGNAVGKSFTTNGQSNRIKCEFTGRVEFQCLASVLFSGASGQAELALGKNGSAPTAAFQLGGCTVSGILAATAFGALAGPLDVVEGDYFELWVDVQGVGSTAQVTKMQLAARRIPG